MPLYRRDFLKILLVTAGGATAVSIVGFGGPLRSSYDWLAFPGLDNTPTGPLNEQTLKALLATTEVLADNPVEKTHYERFFQWRSENLRGYKNLYERFLRTVNDSARRSHGCDFAECEVATRRRILERSFQVRNASSRLEKVRIGVLERDWVQFDEYIVREVLSLFARTDAWIALGYDAWPGMPRGFVRYRQAPRQDGIGRSLLMRRRSRT